MLQGFESEVEAVRAANPRITPTTGVIPPAAERLLEQLAVAGAPEHVRRGLDAWDAVADIVNVALPAGVPWEQIETTIPPPPPDPAIAHGHQPGRRATTCSRSFSMPASAGASRLRHRWCRPPRRRELGVAGLEQPAAVALLGDVAAEQCTGLDVDGAVREHAGELVRLRRIAGLAEAELLELLAVGDVVEEVIGMRSATLDSVGGSSV